MRLPPSARTAAVWDDLPEDVVREIWRWRRTATVRPRAAACVQATWRGYRTRVLVGRFRMLRYLEPFRQYNPSPAAFLARARL